jgi:magnesium-protoporphyrin O-methyltransferase
VADCCNPSGYHHFFNQKEARRNLERYEKKGLDGMAQAMVDYLTSRGVSGRSVLEVGGGIGSLHLELLKAGADRATNVELSGEYEHVASELLEREGYAERVDRRVGDFTDLSGDLEADDVVMNRVVCCYPDMRRLMTAGLGSTNRFLAASFPRDRLGAKIAIGLGNTYCKVRNVDFRAFVHPPADIVAAALESGFTTAFSDRDFVWHGMVFERVA